MSFAVLRSTDELVGRSFKEAFAPCGRNRRIAGGLTPLRRLLERVGHEHACYIVSTHLSLTWDSQLASLLRKHAVHQKLSD